MKKLLLSLAVAFAGVFAANADSYTIQFKADPASNNQGALISDKTALADVIAEGTEYVASFSDLSQAYQACNSGLKIGANKQAGKITINLSEVGAVNATSIEVYASASKNATFQKLEVNGTEFSFATDEVKDEFKVCTIEPNAAVNAITLAKTNASSTTNQQGFVFVNKIVVNYGAGSGDTKKPAGLAWSESTVDVNVDFIEDFVAPTLTNPNNLTVTYSSSNETVGTVNETTGLVALEGEEGSTIITASFAGNNEFRAQEVSYTINVKANTPGSTIDNPMTVAQALEACTANGPKGVYIKGVVTKIVTEYSSQYKNVTFNIADAADDTEVLEAFRSQWSSDVTPTADNNPEVGATVVLYGDLIYYNNTKKELNSGNKIVKYEAPALPSAGLSFPEKSYTINLGEDFTAPALSKATEAAASYTSSIPAVAEVDATTGAVTIKTYGTTVITAKTDATATHLAGEASYTIEVINPEITIDNPLTVSQALAVCENNPHKVFVKGIVTEVLTEYDSNYKNVTFNIADVANGIEVVQAYRAKWGEGVTAPSDNNPEIGATVIISGNLKVYNDTKEFDAGNLIVSYVAPSTSGIEEIEAADNADAVYYNLNGVRVDNPENGLYIRVSGNKATKVLVK